MIWLTLVSLLSSIVAATVLVPIVRLMARRIGMVDKPDEDRKLHREPIALCGGVAVFASLIVGIVATIMFDRHVGDFSLGYVSLQ